MAKAKQKLTPKQIKVIQLIVSGQTQDQAQKTAGINDSTMRRWLRDNVFADEVRLALERMRQTFEARVMGLANNAAVVVGNMIESKDHEKQLEGAKLAFNAAVRLSTRYKELQVEGYVAPAQPLVVFPPGTKFPWQGKAQPQLPEAPLEIEADVVDVEATEVKEE